MFPGQGAQHFGMGAGLYDSEPVFREVVDHCADILEPLIGLDLREVLYRQDADEANALLQETRVTQPALFVTEYAMAKLWLSWGISPSTMIGHSVGEYVAGCLAGVFTLEEGLSLVAHRAKLVQSQPSGTMLAIRKPEAELSALLGNDIDVAAVNSPALTVVAGDFDAIEALEVTLKKQGIVAKRLRTSHAFHSYMMDPVVAPFTEILSAIELKKPTIPYVSNVTSQWISDE
ncbi:MAG: acyltransferase domain-containing protein, partial [Verrucomicrobiales bacterium]